LQTSLPNSNSDKQNTRSGSKRKLKLSGLKDVQNNNIDIENIIMRYVKLSVYL